jgi:F-type H+-transporting ATPase subunit b
VEIDWLTATAQIVNFLVLVWLLKRFLYRPVIDAMDRREARINARLEEAAERERSASEAESGYNREREELERERQAVLDAARNEAESLRRQLMTEAREAAENEREGWHEEVRRERDDFLRALRREAAEGIADTAARVLSDLAGERLDTVVAERFLARLDELDEKTLAPLRKAASLEVTTAFAANDRLRDRLTTGIHAALGNGPELTFHHRPQLGAGVEIRAEGARIGWNLERYLDALETRLGDHLNTDGGSNAGTPGERRA